MRIPVYYEHKVRNGEIPMGWTKVTEAVDIENNVRFLERIRIFYLYMYINK